VAASFINFGVLLFAAYRDRKKVVGSVFVRFFRVRHFSRHWGMMPLLIMKAEGRQRF
jgi:predicted benzoate:H+ symporter BenE